MNAVACLKTRLEKEVPIKLATTTGISMNYKQEIPGLMKVMIWNLHIRPNSALQTVGF